MNLSLSNRRVVFKLPLVTLLTIFSYLSSFAQGSTIHGIYVTLQKDGAETQNVIVSQFVKVVESVPRTRFRRPFLAASSEYLQSVILLEADSDLAFSLLENELAKSKLCDLIYPVRGELVLNGFADVGTTEITLTDTVSQYPNLAMLHDCGNPYSYNDPGALATNHINNMQLPCAWSITRGSSNVVIGVTDTRVNNNHPDLAGKILSTNGTSTSSSADHGTGVSGAAAGIVNNGLCVAGAGFNSRLRTDYASFSSGGTLNSMMRLAERGVQVLTVSVQDDRCEWEFDPQVGVLIRSVFQEIVDMGTTITFAVNTANARALGNIDGAIMVGQADVNGNFKLYLTGNQPQYDSCPLDEHVDVDENIEILVPVINQSRLRNTSCEIRSSNSSIAAPYVAGTVALMLSVNPCLTPPQIEALITSPQNTNTVPNRNDPRWASDLVGVGNLNAYKAVLAAQQGSIGGAEISGPIGVNPNTTYTYSLPYYAGASYSWTVSGAATILSGQGSRSIYVRTASSFSSFEVRCTISKGGCSQTRSKVSFNDGGGGQGSFQVTAYPNPTSGDLNILVDTENKNASQQVSADTTIQATSEELSECRFTLYDPFGREVRRVTGRGDAFIDTRNLKKGFYTLRVTHEAETVSQRIEVRE